MHGNDVRFYKYLGPEASISVLENSSLKWSSPKMFNDPFDFPTAMDFSFRGEDVAEALLDELVRLAYGPDEPVGDPNNKFIAMSLISRRKLKKPPEEEFRRFMAAANDETKERFASGQNERREFLNRFRNQFAVLCLSERHDDLLMWAHYAKDHTGCVLKLRCLPELDRPLCMAKKVNYVPTYPLIANLEDYVKHLTGQIELDYDTLFEIFAFTKSTHWKYESEWRCVSELHNQERGFDFDPLIPEELEAVYVGYRAEEEYKNNLTATIQNSFPDTKLYQARVDIQNYAMLFEELR